MDLATQGAIRLFHDAAMILRRKPTVKIEVKNDLSGFTDAEIEREYGRRYERAEAASSLAMLDEDRPF